MATIMTGTFARRAAYMMTGTIMTTPTSKNRGMPMTKAMSAIAQGSRLFDVPDRIVSTMTSAPPDATSSVPMIEPSTMSSPTSDIVAPTPVVKLLNRLA